MKPVEKVNVPLQSSEHFHGLDFLRAMAMLMGLVFHAPMLYYIPIMADGFQDFGFSTLIGMGLSQVQVLISAVLGAFIMSVILHYLKDLAVGQQ